MRDSQKYSMFKILSGILACALLSGCLGGGSSPTRYYLVDPVDTIALVDEADKPLAIEIIDVHLPQYLERFQIVTRRDGNQLHLSQNNQWGENLRKNLLRTLAGNLARALATIDIGTPLNRSASLPDYRLLVHIAKFERDNDGYVKLVARWQLSDKEDSTPNMYSASLEGDYAIDAAAYEKIVAAMQELYGQLSHRIANTIIEEQGSQEE